jgi:type IV secretion system protein TrbL
MVAAYNNALTGSYSNLHSEITFIVNWAIVIAITIGGLWAAFKDDFPGVLTFLGSKILTIGWCILLVNNWEWLTNMLAGGAVMLGFKTAGQNATEANFLNDPLTIFQDGYTLFTSMISAALHMPTGWESAITDLPVMLEWAVCAFVTIIAYGLVACDIFITIFEFKFACIAAALFLGFMIWDKTAFLAQNSYAFLASSFLKLFTLALIIGVSLSFLNQFVVNPKPDVGNAIAIMFGSIAFFMMAKSADKISRSLISGSPQLNRGDAANAVKNIANGVANAVAAAVKGPAAVAGAASSALDKMKGAATTGGFGTMEHMRSMATAGVGDNANASTLSQMARTGMAEQGGAGNSGSDGSAGT